MRKFEEVMGFQIAMEGVDVKKLDVEDFRDGKCPMYEVICDKYGITDKMVEKHCKEGCSIECGKILMKTLIKKGWVK